MSNLQDVIKDLVRANRILANEGVVDGFGHVSIRHPDRPDRYLLSQSRSPELVSVDDILEMGFDGEPVEQTTRPLYGERFIHAAVFAARDDVNAVVHNHAYEMIPYGVTGVPLKPIFHSAARMGPHIPVWDICDHFGECTNLLVNDLDRGRDMANTLGTDKVVLMRGHGVTVATDTLYDAVLTSIFAHVNARLQQQAMAMGSVKFLHDTEIKTMTDYHAGRKSSKDRQWEYYCKRAGCDVL